MRLRALGAAVTLVLLAACGPGETSDPGPPDAAAPSSPTTSVTTPADLLPLRPGEERRTLTMPEPYTPSAPTGVGTDDYRCFLLDPHLTRNTWLTGTNVLPGNPDVVHHVILFRVPPESVDRAESVDREYDGEGWTCFGGTGIAGEFGDLDVDTAKDMLTEVRRLTEGPLAEYEAGLATHVGGPANARGQPQVIERHRVDRENRDRRAVLGTHVAERRAIRNRQMLQALAEELDELADDLLLAQHFRHREHEVCRRRAFAQVGAFALTTGSGDAEADFVAKDGRAPTSSRSRSSGWRGRLTECFAMAYC